MCIFFRPNIRKTIYEANILKNSSESRPWWCRFCQFCTFFKSSFGSDFEEFFTEKNAFETLQRCNWLNTKFSAAQWFLLSKFPLWKNCATLKSFVCWTQIYFNSFWTKTRILPWKCHLDSLFDLESMPWLGRLLMRFANSNISNTFCCLGCYQISHDHIKQTCTARSLNYLLAAHQHLFETICVGSKIRSTYFYIFRMYVLVLYKHLFCSFDISLVNVPIAIGVNGFSCLIDIVILKMESVWHW